jgi:hypothetical protein
MLATLPVEFIFPATPTESATTPVKDRVIVVVSVSDASSVTSTTSAVSTPIRSTHCPAKSLHFPP